MKNIRMVLTVCILLASVILAVAGWIVLPDTLVLQVTLSGDAGTTLPKPAGLAIPFLISVIFAVLYYLKEDKKHLLIAVLGLATNIFIFLFN